MRYFPAFLDLAGREVLVIGGGAVAVRKIALLRSAGAQVTVIATSAHEELRALAARGSIALQERPFSVAELIAEHGCAPDQSRPWLVVVATRDREFNAAVARAARDARIPCNVVDDRELSTFLMPAIVDRSPVQVAISTGGASPVLARLVRERLEALLDESLGTLAQFGERWRTAARATLRSVTARRQYLSWLLTGPAAGAIRARRHAEADRLATRELARRRRIEAGTGTSKAATPAPGHVTLVGAGPGDPGLLTLKGLRALQEADIVIHDRLASAEVLELARRDAERIDVGKRPGAGTSQEAINALLIEHARRGRRVVRLKGGDPFIFGRGGEEIDALRAANITYDIVPGITAAVAAGASAAIPLTDRRHVKALRLLTGHDSAVLEAFDFSDVAAGRETLAVYMGVAQLPALRERLLRAGAAPALPAALIENASRGSQRVVATTVDGLVRAARAQAVTNPAVALVGQVTAATWSTRHEMLREASP